MIVSAKMVSPRKIICTNDQIGIVMDANRVVENKYYFRRKKNNFFTIAKENTSNVGRTFVNATLFLSNVVREFPSLESNSTML